MTWHMLLGIILGILFLIYILINIAVRVLIVYYTEEGKRAQKGYADVIDIVRIVYNVSLFVVRNTLAKCWLVVIGLKRLIFFNEQKDIRDYLRSKKFASRSSVQPQAILSKKTLILIRHGESMWNMAFNHPFDRTLLPRWARFFGSEFMLGCDIDSVVFDSPLSAAGIEQARQLSDWIETHRLQHHRSTYNVMGSAANGAPTTLGSDASEEVATLLYGGPSTPNMLICTSNLRRALSTCLLVLSGRWERTNTTSEERVRVMKALSEASRNPDSLGICGRELPGPVASPFAEIDKKHITLSNKKYNLSHGYSRLEAVDYTDVLGDGFQHTKKWLEYAAHPANWRTTDKGKKSWTSAESLLFRIISFCDYLSEQESNIVAVFGHSIWFRYFFQTLLWGKIDWPAWLKKMPNCSIVQAELIKYRTNEGLLDFYIDFSTVRYVV